MADLSFIYGTMESGKTTKLLQDNYHYEKNHHKVVVIKPFIDTKGGNKVVTRLNENKEADILLKKNSSLFSKKYLNMILGAKVILVDEAQFLSSKQIKELWEIAHILDIGVICYGLKSDFKGKPFEGSSALFGLADYKNELTVRCICGKLAVFNARCEDGKFVNMGSTVAIDGVKNITYVPLCSDCYLKYVIPDKEKDTIIKFKDLKK